MPGRQQHPRRFLPRGLSDAIDGTEAPRGSCALLQNLIQQPNSKVMVARPAIVPLAPIPFWESATTALFSVGDTVYGMAGSGGGFDAPFVFDPVTATFTTVSGILLNVLPTTQPSAGDWQPPTVTQVGSRIIFTHPGFPGGTSLPAGIYQFTVTQVSGSPVVLGPANVPESIVGFGVAGRTGVVVSLSDGFEFTIGNGLAGNNFFVVASAAGLWIGMTVTGPNLQSVVTNIVGTTITIANNLLANLLGASLAFEGTAIVMSTPAAVSSSVAYTFFSPSPSAKFGWIDISGFTVSVTANTLQGVPILTGAPNLVGIQPGMNIKGPNLYPGTTVTGVNNVNFLVSGQLAPTTQVIQLVVATSTGMVQPGQSISGPFIPPGTTVNSYDPVALKITMSQASTNTSTVNAVTFAISGTVIQVSLSAGDVGTQQNYAVSGGTTALPLWGAGDLSINPLAGTAPAVCVAQMNGRAWFGVNNSDGTVAVQASDAGSPCVQTFITQTLTFGDGIPITAIAPLKLATTLGGIVQSLMVFQGDTNIQQITGEFSTNNLFVNSLNNATGTFAPNTIAATPRGLLFMASDGLRVIDFNANVSDPIGGEGQGLVLPMTNVIFPSRAAAAFNEDTYRLTVTWQPPPTSASVWGTVVRTDEFWFSLAGLGESLSKSVWSGPHTSTMDLICPFASAASFVGAPQGARGFLYQSDTFPSLSSIYVEFSAQLQCVLQTLLMPDNGNQNAMIVTETTVWVGYDSNSGEILVTATDDAGQTLDQTYVWLGPFTTPGQRPVPWHRNLNFRQMSLNFQMVADAVLQIGAIAIREEMLNYQLPYPVPGPFVLGTSVLGGTGVVSP